MKQFLKLLIFGFLITSSISVSAKKLNVLIVTGGHDFDRESFFKMFDTLSDISYTELKQPEANTKLGTIDPQTFDAVVFYDMPQTIAESEKANYYKLLKLGKGLVFLHHSLCSYQQWAEYKTIVGGKYHEKRNTLQSSSYQHDVHFAVNIAKHRHPVTRGIKDFDILDEVYGNTEVLRSVTPLLTTENTLSSKTIGWTHQIENSRIVYIQPGHDKNSYFNPNYQKLVRQAIEFVVR
jgi:type 1 glutamine amidotransferase